MVVMKKENVARAKVNMRVACDVRMHVDMGLCLHRNNQRLSFQRDHPRVGRSMEDHLLFLCRQRQRRRGGEGTILFYGRISMVIQMGYRRGEWDVQSIQKEASRVPCYCQGSVNLMTSIWFCRRWLLWLVKKTLKQNQTQVKVATGGYSYNGQRFILFLILVCKAMRLWQLQTLATFLIK